MSDYPPHVQAVLDAVLDVCRPDSGILTYPTGAVQALIDAVAAYREAIAPPEPFERFVLRYVNGKFSKSLHRTEATTITLAEAEQVWRCTVTPVERVR